MASSRGPSLTSLPHLKYLSSPYWWLLYDVTLAFRCGTYHNQNLFVIYYLSFSLQVSAQISPLERPSMTTQGKESPFPIMFYFITQLCYYSYYIGSHYLANTLPPPRIHFSSPLDYKFYESLLTLSIWKESSGGRGFMCPIQLRELLWASPALRMMPHIIHT